MKFHAVSLAIAAAIATIAVPANAAEVTLNGASCFPIGSPTSKPFEAVVEAINKQGKGVVQVKLIGGAPAIGSPFTLTQKMAAGAYDMVGCTEAYFGNIFPEGPALRLAEKPYAELRKNGAIAYVQKLLNAKGVYFLGRHHVSGKFHLWLNKEISEPNLKGLHLRVSPVYTAFFTSLGATVQQSDIASVYTYMENGTVQGFGWPLIDWVPSWAKVTKFRVDPGFYSGTLHTVMNLRTWNSLSPEAKKIVQAVVQDFENKSEPGSAEYNAKAQKQLDWLAKQGVKTITFSGEKGKKWLDAAREAGWKEVFDRSPKHAAELKKLFAQ